MLFAPAVGSSLMMLLWSPLCSRLSRPVSASRADPHVHHRTFFRVPRHSFPSEAAHNTPSQKLRFAEPPHALTCCAWSGSPQPHSEENSSPSRHCAWRSVIPELGWPPCRRHVVDSAVPRVVHFCASLELLRRWSLCLEVCTQTAFCTFRQALLCSASRDRALVCSGSSCFRRHPSQVVNLSTDTIVPQLFPLRLALVWLCPLRPPGRAPAEGQ